MDRYREELIERIDKSIFTRGCFKMPYAFIEEKWLADASGKVHWGVVQTIVTELNQRPHHKCQIVRHWQFTGLFIRFLDNTSTKGDHGDAWFFLGLLVLFTAVLVTTAGNLYDATVGEIILYGTNLFVLYPMLAYLTYIATLEQRYIRELK